MQRRLECYGKLFPAALRASRGVRGKVFGYRVDHVGTVDPGRTLTTDVGAWHECLRCQDREGCYRLSVGTLLMRIAVGS